VVKSLDQLTAPPRTPVRTTLDSRNGSGRPEAATVAGVNPADGLLVRQSTPRGAVNRPRSPVRRRRARPGASSASTPGMRPSRWSRPPICSATATAPRHLPRLPAHGQSSTASRSANFEGRSTRRPGSASPTDAFAARRATRRSSARVSAGEAATTKIVTEAARFGFGAPVELGIPGRRRRQGPDAHSPRFELAATAIGQSGVVSPARLLIMAGLSPATVQSGQWHAPGWSSTPRPHPASAPRRWRPETGDPPRLDPTVRQSLDALMHAVVRGGTGSRRRAVAGQGRGRQRRARLEFGVADPPQTHAWSSATRPQLALSPSSSRAAGVGGAGRCARGGPASLGAAG